MNVQLFFVLFFVLIDLSFEKMPRKFVELQKKCFIFTNDWYVLVYAAK